VNEGELAAWTGFKDVCSIFFWNSKAYNYQEIVKKLIQSYEMIRRNMSLNIQFLHSHLDFFPQHLGAVNVEHGEHFHEDIALMENYQGKCSVNVMSDYCWSIIRDVPETNYKWKLLIKINFKISKS
jgi:hypothetical protein